MRLTEPPIFLFSISSPFMQSLKIKNKDFFVIALQFHDKPQVFLCSTSSQCTCNPVIAQQVLWLMWRMRSLSLSRSPALSSPADYREKKTVRCSYKRWRAQEGNRYESQRLLVLTVRAFHLTLDKDQTAGSCSVTAKHTEKNVRGETLWEQHYSGYHSTGSLNTGLMLTKGWRALCDYHRLSHLTPCCPAYPSALPPPTHTHTNTHSVSQKM